MKTNPESSAYPHSHGIYENGLTKREYFAAMAMQGEIASFSGLSEYANPEIVASRAVAFADALIVELNGEAGEPRQLQSQRDTRSTRRIIDGGTR